MIVWLYERIIKSMNVRRLLILLAALVILAAVLGPIGTGLITFHVSVDANNQYIGGEVATIILAFALIILAKSKKPIAVPVSMGICIYLIYTFITVVMGQSYDRYTGANAENAFMLYAAITTIGFISVALMGVQYMRQNELIKVEKVKKRVANTLIVLAGLFGLLWAMQIVSFHVGGPSVEYQSDKALFWLIKYLDYGFLLPFFTMLGIGIHRKSIVASNVSIVALTIGVCLTLAIGCMAVAQTVLGSTNAVPVIAMMFAILCWLNWLLFSVYRSTRV